MSPCLLGGGEQTSLSAGDFYPPLKPFGAKLPAPNGNCRSLLKRAYQANFNKRVGLAPEIDYPSCAVCRRLWNTLYRRIFSFRLVSFLFFAEDPAPGDHTKENDGGRNDDDK